MELPPKIVLKDKGEKKNLPTVKQLVATMKWKTQVDLDLMACYEVNPKRFSRKGTT